MGLNGVSDLFHTQLQSEIGILSIVLKANTIIKSRSYGLWRRVVSR